MKILDLPVALRDKLGSASARRYRRAGQVPCNLYGSGQENINLVADVHALEGVLKAHTALVRLKLGDDEQTALLRAVNWDVFGEEVEHIDLVRVEMEDEVKIKVPVHCMGIPAGTSEGGELQVVKADLEVFSRVASIPSEIRIDVSGLHIHDAIHVGEVDFPEHVRPAHDERELVVHLVPPRKVVEPVPEVAEVGVEGEVPPEEGAEEPAEKPSAGEKS
ncbi:MAG: 50S ribosomal protein L25 [Planctomycetota bacterium]|jgi:large subunit ribosomal protein L25